MIPGMVRFLLLWIPIIAFVLLCGGFMHWLAGHPTMFAGVAISIRILAAVVSIALFGVLVGSVIASRRASRS
jgi:hypothetical protein